MALFPASFIDDLKSHADIVQVVQDAAAYQRLMALAENAEMAEFLVVVLEEPFIHDLEHLLGHERRAGVIEMHDRRARRRVLPHAVEVDHG